jgi:hypothetical protein
VGDGRADDQAYGESFKIKKKLKFVENRRKWKQNARVR